MWDINTVQRNICDIITNISNSTIITLQVYAPPLLGGFHIKGVRMLVVSLRGVNFSFRSHLGCSGQNAVNVSFRVVVSFRGRKKLGPRPDWSPLGV